MSTTNEAGANRNRPRNRTTTNGAPVFVSWGGNSTGRALPAFLRDISLTGALIETTTSLPAETAVVIRLMKGGAAVRARVVKVSERGRLFTTPWWSKRICRVRVAFVDGCSYEFFRTAADVLFGVNLPDRPDVTRDDGYRETA